MIFLTLNLTNAHVRSMAAARIRREVNQTLPWLLCVLCRSVDSGAKVYALNITLQHLLGDRQRHPMPPNVDDS
ncbi:Uncharacterised protein [BD1-7 clade bacterium]|uniref:Uncharacterized protein n=1 Tax=BD1-7 clade bacterium TaxID=2029982 RepID=A0A5S9NNY5_9GAMM|nr:Uncharacterised protein [BD1-7 clade bacterium]